MSSRGNIIDFTARRKKRTSSPSLKGQSLSSGSPPPERDMERTKTSEPLPDVVNLTELRKNLLSGERRRVKRTLLREFIGAFIVVPQRGLAKVELADISPEGLSFDLNEDLGFPRHHDEIAMRIYLNKQTYFPFILKITNVRRHQEEAATRYGGRFVSGTINEVALIHFVKFIENVSSCLKQDSGDIMVSNLTE